MTALDRIIEDNVFEITEVTRYCERLDDYVDKKVYLARKEGVHAFKKNLHADDILFYHFIDARTFVSRSGKPLDSVMGCMRACIEIETSLADSKDVVVYCGIAKQRSPLVVAMWLSWTKGISLKTAYDIVEGKVSHFIDRCDKWVNVCGSVRIPPARVSPLDDDNS